jgi:hypothetical protein
VPDEAACVSNASASASLRRLPHPALPESSHLLPNPNKVTTGAEPERIQISGKFLHQCFAVLSHHIYSAWLSLIPRATCLGRRPEIQRKHPIRTVSLPTARNQTSRGCQGTPSVLRAIIATGPRGGAQLHRLQTTIHVLKSLGRK